MVDLSALPLAPPPASPEDATLSTQEVVEIRDSHRQLHTILAQLLAKIPPIAAVRVNGASSAAPLSLRTRFPDVDAAVLSAIIIRIQGRRPAQTRPHQPRQGNRVHVQWRNLPIRS
ncbi:hypothetical protein H2248_004683 [Termitomyces sp. 'cryptogamus']|nr:hypothetical protein H2248_004683 [Termitomyces sp. 'cryptogamus']